MARTPQIVFVVRDQSFDISVNGLLPLTYHYLYFEGNQVAATQYKPANGKLGEPLISDANGQLNLTYYYVSNAPEVYTALTDYYNFISSIAGRKELVVANINVNTLSNTYKTSAFSYATNFINIEAYRPTEQEFQAGFGER